MTVERRPSGKSGRITIRGTGTGGDFDEQTAVDPPRRFRSADTVERPTTGPSLAAARQIIEVKMVEDKSPDPRSPARWRLFEIWTSNHVYAIDTDLVCIQVGNRQTGKTDPNHAFVGARLTGGQIGKATAMSLTHPFPVPGTEAVFHLKTGRQRYGTTSKVERVVMRIRTTRVVTAEDEASIWDEVTGGFEDPTRR